MSGFHPPKVRKPKGFYRTGLNVQHYRSVMEGAGWLSVMQIAAMLSDKISPEAAHRVASMKSPNSEASFDIIRVRGERSIVRQRLGTFLFKGKVERDGKGKEARWRWVETQNDQAGKDSPGRGHAKP